MHTRRIGVIILLIAVGATVWWLARQPHRGGFSIPNQPLSQDIYAWQRLWNEPVQRAVRTEATNFRRLVILAAEMSVREGDLRGTEFEPDYRVLRESGSPIGLAIRIGPLPASRASMLEPGSEQTRQIAQLIAQVLTKARAAGIEVAEIQIDFDSAESKLTGYVNWVRAVKASVAPVPVVITALPSWLGHRDFGELARTAGSYVLQVHSLHRPDGPDAPMTLCDPREAVDAIARAARHGAPFRVALPTYSYLAGFSPEGRLLGLSAEGPVPSWPAGTVLRVMRSDPETLADLVRQLTEAHPPEMTGIIWYRLPVEQDTMNWRAATLHAVRSGRRPAANVQIDLVRSQPGLLDVYLENTGNADAPMHWEAKLTWNAADLIAAEALGGFERLDEPEGVVTLRAANVPVGRWIAPGERIHIGWLRLSPDTEVQAHVSRAARDSSN